MTTTKSTSTSKSTSKPNRKLLSGNSLHPTVATITGLVPKLVKHRISAAASTSSSCGAVDPCGLAYVCDHHRIYVWEHVPCTLQESLVLPIRGCILQHPEYYSTTNYNANTNNANTVGSDNAVKGKGESLAGITPDLVCLAPYHNTANASMMSGISSIMVKNAAGTIPSYSLFASSPNGVLCLWSHALGTISANSNSNVLNNDISSGSRNSNGGMITDEQQMEDDVSLCGIPPCASLRLPLLLSEQECVQSVHSMHPVGFLVCTNHGRIFVVLRQGRELLAKLLPEFSAAAIGVKQGSMVGASASGVFHTVGRMLFGSSSSSTTPTNINLGTSTHLKQQQHLRKRLHVMVLPECITRDTSISGDNSSNINTDASTTVNTTPAALRRPTRRTRTSIDSATTNTTTIIPSSSTTPSTIVLAATCNRSCIVLSQDIRYCYTGTLMLNSGLNCEEYVQVHSQQQQQQKVGVYEVVKYAIEQDWYQNVEDDASTAMSASKDGIAFELVQSKVSTDGNVMALLIQANTQKEDRWYLLLCTTPSTTNATSSSGKIKGVDVLACQWLNRIPSNSSTHQSYPMGLELVLHPTNTTHPYMLHTFFNTITSSTTTTMGAILTSSPSSSSATTTTIISGRYKHTYRYTDYTLPSPHHLVNCGTLHFSDMVQCMTQQGVMLSIGLHVDAAYWCANHTNANTNTNIMSSINAGSEEEDRAVAILTDHLYSAFMQYLPSKFHSTTGTNKHATTYLPIVPPSLQHASSSTLQQCTIRVATLLLQHHDTDADSDMDMDSQKISSTSLHRMRSTATTGSTNSASITAKSMTSLELLQHRILTYHTKYVPFLHHTGLYHKLSLSTRYILRNYTEIVHATHSIFEYLNHMSQSHPYNMNYGDENEEEVREVLLQYLRVLLQDGTVLVPTLQQLLSRTTTGSRYLHHASFVLCTALSEVLLHREEWSTDVFQVPIAGTKTYDDSTTPVVWTDTKEVRNLLRTQLKSLQRAQVYNEDVTFQVQTLTKALWQSYHDQCATWYQSGTPPTSNIEEYEEVCTLCTSMLREYVPVSVSDGTTSYALECCVRYRYFQGVMQILHSSTNENHLNENHPHSIQMGLSQVLSYATPKAATSSDEDEDESYTSLCNALDCITHVPFVLYALQWYTRQQWYACVVQLGTVHPQILQEYLNQYNGTTASIISSKSGTKCMQEGRIDVEWISAIRGSKYGGLCRTLQQCTSTSHSKKRMVSKHKFLLSLGKIACKLVQDDEDNSTTIVDSSHFHNGLQLLQAQDMLYQSSSLEQTVQSGEELFTYALQCLHNANIATSIASTTSAKAAIRSSKDQRVHIAVIALAIAEAYSSSLDNDTISGNTKYNASDNSVEYELAGRVYSEIISAEVELWRSISNMKRQVKEQDMKIAMVRVYKFNDIYVCFCRVKFVCIYRCDFHSLCCNFYKICMIRNQRCYLLYTRSTLLLVQLLL